MIVTRDAIEELRSRVDEISELIDGDASGIWMDQMADRLEECLGNLVIENIIESQKGSLQ